jgi:uncharacterized protein with GYD domain
MKKKVLKVLTSTIFFALWAFSASAITCIEGQPPTELASVLDAIRNVLAAIGISVAVIYIILGGYDFITSGGSAEKMGTARTRILYALIGIGIILIAAVLANIVKAILCTTSVSV